ncbi:SpaA isopeptide-forming pilin-related protein [Collinsella tanakaei]|uniref:SpaA isopeptide-forming pilin-related protein n=1 Tax=Collinsella tanakaei TaxID=626935 RepID=UPI0025A45836|nr:SpaA isopeptide-forming pilin-related protein [Collinsella tanakaei]MDM8246182.1 SpaA isopeptide-forming pilin-related protein [Collinsella tanakaei]
MQYAKTSGHYIQEGNFGQGKLLYNIKVSTKLNQSNEFVIYDTPDINQVFSGTLQLAIPKDYGGGTPVVLWDGENEYIGEGDEFSRMEIYLEDSYFLTKDAASPNVPRQAGYEGVTLTFEDRIYEGWDGESEEPAAVPKNILLSKPSGESLTEDEQKLIEDAGGLNNTVGKGFKLRIKNFKGNGRSEGGYFTLLYYTDIVNNSPVLNEDGLPVYLNTSSYYAQEIPNCDPDTGVCEPIECEKSDLQAIVEGENTIEGDLDTGDIDVSFIDPYGIASVTKYGKLDDESGQIEAPLVGAVFSIHEVAEDGSVGDVAETPDGVKLASLVSNADGKLCIQNADGTLGDPVTLKLKRGNYWLVEDEAPDGYEPAENTVLTVGLIQQETRVVNVKKDVEPEKILPTAVGLVAYEGGLGSHNDPDAGAGDALPEPVWRAQWEGWTITVDGEAWNSSEKGMPFNWGYFDDSIENPTPEDVANTPADKGEYVLRAWPLEGNPEVLATDAEGKVYLLDLDPERRRSRRRHARGARRRYLGHSGRRSPRPNRRRLPAHGSRHRVRGNRHAGRRHHPQASPQLAFLSHRPGAYGPRPCHAEPHRLGSRHFGSICIFQRSSRPLRATPVSGLRSNQPKTPPETRRLARLGRLAPPVSQPEKCISTQNV